MFTVVFFVGEFWLNYQGIYPEVVDLVNTLGKGGLHFCNFEFTNYLWYFFIKTFLLSSSFPNICMSFVPVG